MLERGVLRLDGTEVDRSPIAKKDVKLELTGVFSHWVSRVKSLSHRVPASEASAFGLRPRNSSLSAS
jgi:hypothetical protein